MELKVTNESKHITSVQSVKQYSDLEKTKIAEAAKGFESILTSMMLKSMTSGEEGGLFGTEGYGNDMFDALFTNEIAAYMSKGKGLGIADVLYKNMTGDKLTPEVTKKIDQIIPAKTDVIEKKAPAETVNTSASKISPSNKSISRISQYEDHITEASNKYGVDPHLIKSVILTESAGNERAYSKCKAKGLMQLLDGTAKDMGVQNIWDPKQNIMGGTKYLANMLRQYKGDVKLALASYNAGPGAVNKYNGIPPYKETQNYVKRVLGYYNHLNSL